MLRRTFWILTILWLIGLPISRGFALGNEISLQNKSKALSHYILAVYHELNGESTQAFEHYRNTVRLDPSQATAFVRLAAYNIRFDHLDDAISQLKKVIELNPHEVQAHYLLALVYSSQKKLDLAVLEYESVLKKATADNPLNIETHAYLAQLYYAQGKIEQALQQFKDILSINPEHISANYLLGSIYLDRNQFDLATEHYRKVIRLRPDHDGALNALAYSYAEQGIQLSQAHTMARLAIDLDPLNGAYYDTYGWVLYKQGLYTESLMTLQKAENLIQDPIVYEHLGDVYKALNQISFARRAWMKSLEYNARQPAIRQKLDALDKSQALESSSQ